MQVGSRSGAEAGLARVFEDPRGRLTLVPFDELPFVPARSYVLSAIPDGGCRGGHANRTQHRFLVVLCGSAEITIARDGGRHSEMLGTGDTVLVPPGVWHEIRAVGPDLIVLALAEGAYDPDDRIDDRATTG